MKRRTFLAETGFLGVAVPLALNSAIISSCSGDRTKSRKNYSPEELGMYSFVDRAPDGKPLRAALFGCGSRGTGAATQFLSAGSDLSIVALADIFPDRMEQCRKILKEQTNNSVPDTNCFLGFDAYKKAMEIEGGVDVVLICTPTHFHPEQFKAAVEAEKHVFMEKPAAVDPSGIRTVLAAAKVALSKGLTVITGNQRRHRRDYWEAYQQIRNGIIGEVIAATAHWNTGGGWNRFRRPDWTDMEYCIRNWFNIKWLSGDHILDQTVHNIDIATWFIGQFPVKAVGYGGKARRESGDIFDFFSIDYLYDHNKRMLATARQISGCDSNVSEQVIGSAGIALLNDENNIQIVDYAGNILWKYDYINKPVRNPYEQEHVHLVESIRLNKKINQAEDLAYSTQVAILGRESAYTGKPYTWDEMMVSNLRYGPTEYKLGPVPEYKEGAISIPGTSPTK